ncbi:MAG: hypothetical protein RR523_06090 [Cetobacterium sp.]
MTEKEINFVLTMMAVSGCWVCTCCVPILSANPSSKAGRFIFKFGMSLVLGAIFLAQILQ